MEKTPYLFIIGTLILLVPSCTKEKTITLPTLTTSIISSVNTISAQSGGVISNDGGATITARGVCWSTSSSPTTSDSKTSDIKDTTTFTSSLTGLLANTTYYVRAYATNSTGTAYGNEISFTTNQSSLIGAWGYRNSEETAVLTFIDDSHFVISETEETQVFGNYGIEVGTYTWNAATGAFTSSIYIGSNENWGFNPSPLTINVNKDTIYLGFEDGTKSVPKISSTTNSLIGSWRNLNADASEVEVMTFMDNSRWIFSEGSRTSDATGHSGIEVGSYTWNSSDGAFSYIKNLDSNGTWGVQISNPSTITVNKDTIIVSNSGVIETKVYKIK